MARPARPWFRFYVEAVHDRKLRRLLPAYRWLFVACLAAARQSCEPGVLLVGENDPMTVDDLVDFAGMPRSVVIAGMQALIFTGVVMVDKSHPRERFFIPAWGDRQFESDDVTKRTEKHRKERSNDVPKNVPTPFQGTPPDTEADTDTETPPSLVDKIVDGVFAKVLAEKQKAGEGIRSVDGFRSWWDANQGDGCRLRAEKMVEDYDFLNVGQYVAATMSTTTPQWAASMRRTG